MVDFRVWSLGFSRLEVGPATPQPWRRGFLPLWPALSSVPAGRARDPPAVRKYGHVVEIRTARMSLCHVVEIRTARMSLCHVVEIRTARMSLCGMQPSEVLLCTLPLAQGLGFGVWGLGFGVSGLGGEILITW